MDLTRRGFLRASTSAVIALLATPTIRVGAARAAGLEPVLVPVFLRGGADFLNLVVPHGDPDYARARPGIGLSSRAVVDLDGFFGLHPELGPLHRYFRDGRLAAVHACGSPHPTKSHFQAEQYLETGVPGRQSIATGWLARYANAAPLREPWATVTLGSRPTRALAGATASLTVTSLDIFQLSGQHADARRAAILRMAAGANGLYREGATSAFRALDAVHSVTVAPRVSYPETSVARALVQVAALIRSRIGVRVAAVEMSGWDTHEGAKGRMTSRARELAEALAAFATDLGSDLDRTIVLVMTEFGRRVAENGSGGTEHGRAAAMLALGGPVRGGRVLLRGGRWPGLAPAQLDGGLDLRVTTDFRDVFAEVLYRHMGLSNLAPVFPGYAVSSSRFPGVVG